MDAPPLAPISPPGAPGAFHAALGSVSPLPRTGSQPHVGACGGVGGVAVLFARRDSIYKTIPGLDVWDADRDARNYQGPYPVIAHPPCRGWGCLRVMSKATPEEKALGPWAVEQVRKWGGVLEHPRGSTLWRAAGLPKPGLGHDSFGGFALAVEQFWWGHRAHKATWLYICGVRRADVPPMPLKFGWAPNVVTNIHGLRSGMPGYRKEITKREREATPLLFAAWLVCLAGRAAGAGVGRGTQASQPKTLNCDSTTTR